jgi:hypothetical protein
MIKAGARNHIALSIESKFLKPIQSHDRAKEATNPAVMPTMA